MPRTSPREQINERIRGNSYYCDPKRSSLLIKEQREYWRKRVRKVYMELLEQDQRQGEIANNLRQRFSQVGLQRVTLYEWTRDLPRADEALSQHMRNNRKKWEERK